ncbi:hypothetical protein SAMN02745166_05086 [Prosthecobacter debontii]|uniref:Cellulase (Glycosyl hydrolase family 5) n=2 Tax=Prosthecobacter debontii TaxID=48467 RepID=A0A1T4Z4Y8_9BACT|nr:hypothetical protein SAMN02745166_05086 [Prosthecobacter debontii]
MGGVSVLHGLRRPDYPAPQTPTDPMRPLLFLLALTLASPALQAATTVSITGGDFFIHGKPTYEGRVWQGQRIEGLLLNSRMVQASFDDRNPATVEQWAYPDTKQWDAERNTTEFIAQMPVWRAHGLLAITLNLQGGSPYGYSKDQPWHNSAINPDGTLDPAYLARIGRVIEKADELGMAVILGYFYFGQDERVKDEAAVIRAVEAVTRWILDQGWQHVLVEINNEANIKKYDHAILKADRVHELIQRVQAVQKDGRRLLVSTSFGGGAVPSPGVIECADFLLIHGNGVKGPEAMQKFITRVKTAAAGKSYPIVINEDDHFDFDQPNNNFTSAIKEHVSWGYFDYRMKGEGYEEGYQSVPVNWGLSSARKRGFFTLLKQITGTP